MKTANQLQIDIMEVNIAYIEHLFGQLSDREKNLYKLEWINIHAKTWRKIYNKHKKGEIL